MKLRKFFLLGLGVCALMNTSVSASDVLCPDFGDLQCPHVAPGNEIVCVGAEPWTIGSPLEKGQQSRPEFSSVEANQDTQTCDYYSNGVLALKLRKQQPNCTAIKGPKPGFDCP